MKHKSKIPVEHIEEEALNGKDILKKYFDASSKRVGRPYKTLEKQRETIKTNLDLTTGFAAELDSIADHLNISRQAVIKMFLRQALDQHYLANQKKESA
jgi:hypothetical protein